MASDYGGLAIMPKQYVYDIIGDIHGRAAELETLLLKLGYYIGEDGVYRPPKVPGVERKAIFVGDFIDKGTRNFRTLDIVRGMVTRGHARAIMGNHEFNAVQFHTDIEGNPMMTGRGQTSIRKQSDSAIRQHVHFLKEMGEDSEKGRSHIEWMKQLPIYIDEPGFRVIHAQWVPSALQTLDDAGILEYPPGVIQNSHFRGEARIKGSAWPRFYDKGSAEFKAMEDLVSGIEIPLEREFEDKNKIRRTEARLAWWVDPDKIPGMQDANGQNRIQLLRDIVVNVPRDFLGEEPVTDEQRAILRAYQPDKMTVFGHYGRTSVGAEWLSEKAICVDQIEAGRLSATSLTTDEMGTILEVDSVSVENLSREELLRREQAQAALDESGIVLPGRRWLYKDSYSGRSHSGGR